MTLSESPLSSVIQPLGSLGIYGRRVTESVVGRSVELQAVDQELSSSRSGIACITLDGEPGIGKTRLMLAAEELARTKGWIAIAVTADEEIRGAFLLARSLFGSPATQEAADGTPAQQPLQKVCDALVSMDDPGLESLSPDRQLARVFDLAALAFRALAEIKPLLILVDDLQWADEDSLRMLRYIVRTNASSRIVFMFAGRPDEVAFVNEAVTLLADMDRMGLLRRLKLGRFSQLESTEFLRQVLGADINPASAAVMHSQAEGVPFILAEQVHAYRDAGMIQQIDRVWTLARNAERLLPSNVRTLIQRRSARLPESTKYSLAEAGVLGRRFSLRDLRDIEIRVGDEARDIDSLAESLAPAVAAGLLVQHPDDSAADYSFTHEQVRDYSVDTLSPPRRRAIHEAIVDMLTAGGEPSQECLTILAHHSLAAGRSELAAQTSIEAGRKALEAHAPEEVLRLVDLAQPVASGPQIRIELLRLQDDALEMLRRTSHRLEGLAQLMALAEALQDSHLEMETMLRRAAALRLSGDHDRAAELAVRVRQLAAEKDDAQTELAACLELGQNYLRSEIGEGYTPAAAEVDLDGGADAYTRALKIAEELGDDANIAAASRELGVIAVSRVSSWFAAKVQAGEHMEFVRRVVAGEKLEEILPTLPIAPYAYEAGDRFHRALELYEKLGDRKGAMSTIIAMAYVSWGVDIHLPGSAKRIEEIRRLTNRMKSLTNDSERALAEVQMLYGSHVYSRAKVFPDSALTKGMEAYTEAQVIGERAVEFAAAGGVALTYGEMGAMEEAEQWLSKAASVALDAPSPLRAYMLESWRGRISTMARDVAGMREHLERALELATGQGHSATRCEALAQLALSAAQLAAEHKDEELLALAERCCEETKALMRVLPGHPPWGAQADAAAARVALIRGANEAAADAGRAALAALKAAMSEDLSLDVLLPAAEALLTAGTEEEGEEIRDRLRLVLSLLVPRIVDEDVRVRWLRGPIGAELTRLAGPLDTPAPATESTGSAAVQLADEDTALLRLLIEGRTNSEIADQLGTTEELVVRQLAELFGKIGASSRADATSVALMSKLV